MAMTEVFDKLKALQDILAEKYSLMAKIEDSPKQLFTQDELLVRLRKEFLETSEVYDKVKAEVGQLQVELEEAQKSREAGEKGMDNISTHREYEALQKQIDEASAREASIRSDLQKKDKEREELDEKLRMDEEMIKAQEADLNANKATLESEVQSYQGQIKELEAKESEITPGLDGEIVYKFQRIIQRNREGIVAVKNGVCTGCHMILPAQFANEVHEGEKILFCPYCSRILFHEDVAEGEEAEDFLSMDETGTLADFDDEFSDEYDEESEGLDDDSLDDGEEKSISFDE
ncbi:MAG: C4-type zinc ribbon domain-containing protein [Spirochaetia bacterium]|uniref:zinc ribbon domain-containing protein n=1 Tax=Treponema berlinense TaxID=225004 RepID=UPI0026EFFD23|nr:C4-type zinc ribbon domain-containing protein [Treponema berlinense]MDD5789614.1 C4-type zinc ribbon domain-containing protein [Spirochaetia bacterium]